jgi:hypothetical protein
MAGRELVGADGLTNSQWLAARGDVEQEKQFRQENEEKDKGKKKKESVSNTNLNNATGTQKANMNPTIPIGMGQIIRGLGSLLGEAAMGALGIITLAFTMEGDTPNKENVPIRIALGVDAFLNDFSAKVMAVPLKAGYIEQFEGKDTIIPTIIALGQKPNVTFHFNLSTLNGKVNDPANLLRYSDKVTTSEFITVLSLFKEKTTFYVKSGSIYKPIILK